MPGRAVSGTQRSTQRPTTEATRWTRMVPSVGTARQASASSMCGGGGTTDCGEWGAAPYCRVYPVVRVSASRSLHRLPCGESLPTVTRAAPIPAVAEMVSHHAFRHAAPCRVRCVSQRPTCGGPCCVPTSQVGRQSEAAVVIGWAGSRCKHTVLRVVSRLPRGCGPWFHLACQRRGAPWYVPLKAHHSHTCHWVQRLKPVQPSWQDVSPAVR